MNALRRFRPSLALTVAAALIFTATVSLARWQFDRAAEKRALESAATAGITAPAALTLHAAAAVTPFQRAAVIGAFQPEGEVLLDNRIHRRRPGYHVITPFLLADGGAVVINRGWLQGAVRRSDLPHYPPPPRGRVTVGGIFYPDEANAFVLSDDAGAGQRVRQRLHLAALAHEMGLPLMTLQLIQAPPTTAPLLPVSVRVDFKSARSTAYAWQWLTFAALTVVFFIILGRRRE